MKPRSNPKTRRLVLERRGEKPRRSAVRRRRAVPPPRELDALRHAASPPSSPLRGDGSRCSVVGAAPAPAAPSTRLALQL